MSPVNCPICGNETHRSRTRGVWKRLFSTLFSKKSYRCSKCGWKGWIIQKKIFYRKHRARSAFLYLIFLLAAIYFSYQIVTKMAEIRKSAGTVEVSP